MTIALPLTNEFKGELNSSFTATGEKYSWWPEHMSALKDGKPPPGPLTTTVMLTDVCNATCAFCSTLTREGDTLPFLDLDEYLTTLCSLGLKGVTYSGGGNPILARDKESGANFDDMVELAYSKGLSIGLITNGMPMKQYPCGRWSWKTVKPETLDKLAWCRISCASLDHEEDRTVYVPDFDRSKTVLGFSYVLHDIYYDKLEPNHGKVSTIEDLKGHTPDRIEYGHDRIPWLQEQLKFLVDTYKPKYFRAIPNCLQENQIKDRCDALKKMCDAIDPNVCFTQYKPPFGKVNTTTEGPGRCTIGYLHLTLNSDGWVFPCTSVVLNETAGHKFASQWRICRFNEVANIYKMPLHSLVNSKKHCAGCVFWQQNKYLDEVIDGTIVPVKPDKEPVHACFV